MLKIGTSDGVCDSARKYASRKFKAQREGKLLGVAAEMSNIGQGGSKGLAPSRPSCKSAHFSLGQVRQSIQFLTTFS